MPRVIEAVLRRVDEIERVADLIRTARTRRLLVTGNGAAHYVGLALWATSLRRPAPAIEVVNVPAGALAGGWVRWREGDTLLVVSSSGELRDVVELLDGPMATPLVAITASPASSIGRAAEGLIPVAVDAQDAVTHTQAHVGNLAAALGLWAALSGDETLRTELADLPARCSGGLAAAPGWIDEQVASSPVPAAGIAFGSGEAWAAATETALLLKEVANIPCEGQETREGATSGMYALGPGQLAVAIPVRGDRLIGEAEDVCSRTGAATLRLPGATDVDPSLAPIASFPYALALATSFGVRQGLDVDHPAWVADYYRTARAAGAGHTMGDD